MQTVSEGMPMPEPEPVLLADYDYELPEERIAQTPVEPRDSARLLVVPRHSEGGTEGRTEGGRFEHRVFRDLPDLLHPDDLLVVNETRVSAVRLIGQRPGGGEVEALLLRPAPEHGADAYAALVRPGRRVRIGDHLEFAQAGLLAQVLAVTPEGGRVLRFTLAGAASGDISERLEKGGRTPLPPYITAPLPDGRRYQTVYARVPGSAAAPTAGLHFTQDLLERISGIGVGIVRVRLDVGLGTFRPIRTLDVREHEMHTEALSVSEETAAAINRCTGRVIAVGTTTLRALETAALAGSERESHTGRLTGERIRPFTGETRLFIYPGFPFRAVDALITNFHQPHSTLLLLVAAFVGRSTMRAAYKTALEEGYRFLSFGDAMIAL